MSEIPAELAAVMAATDPDRLETGETETPVDTQKDGLRELYGKICDDITSRGTWLDRQTTWYKMRHDGLRRRNKPFPLAADLHYPLADSIIEKFKPFYFDQLFATETVASFVAKVPELVPLAGDCSYWYDWKLKQKSNLESEILLSIDRMLQTGFVPVKVYWDADKGELAFDCIEPQHCIVPDYARGLEDADRVTLVHQLTVDQYKRDARFKRKETDFIDLIKGSGDTDNGNDSRLRQAKERREGITHSESSDIIIVWEIWQQKGQSEWVVSWISPLQPEEPLRPTQANPFKHGKLPVVRFEMELCDKGHYSSRGICERVAPDESYLSKLWSSKSDYMTFCNQPLFTSANPIPNAGNLRLIPGTVLPGIGLQAVKMPEPPVSFDQEMGSTRQIAEYNIGMPDFGLGEQGQTGKDPRTATEVNKLSGLLGASVNLRARTFRMALGKLLRMGWETLIQYDRDTQFFMDGEAKTLPEQALVADAWLIEPSGSSESWNKAGQIQRLMGMRQTFMTPEPAPYINFAELDKSIIAIDDPRNLKRFFIDPQQKAQSEYEDEAKTIPTLMLGLPLPSNPADDQIPRIKCLVDFLHQRSAMGAPVDPIAIHAIKARIQSHLQVLATKDPKAAQQIAQEIVSMSQGGQPQPGMPPQGGPAPAPQGPPPIQPEQPPQPGAMPQ